MAGAGSARHGAPAAADSLLDVLSAAADAARVAVDGLGPAARRSPGSRPGQYHLDLVADEVLVGILAGASIPVLSEESGLTGAPDGALLAVVDPIDGSTNASLGIPWYATSVCVLDGDGPLVALVVNQVSGTRYEAVRGGGALRDGEPISPTACETLGSAVVGVSGLPGAYPGWAQFRALGAASLDLCGVASGMLDAYRVAGRSTLRVWDYLGALLVLQEAGAVAAELDGKSLVVRDSSRRRPAAAGTASLLGQLVSAEA